MWSPKDEELPPLTDTWRWQREKRWKDLVASPNGTKSHGTGDVTAAFW